MPPIQGSLTIVAAWQNQVQNAGGFGARGQGPDSIDFSLAPNLTTFNQQWSGDVTIGSGSHYDFNVTNPPAASSGVAAGQNLDAESVSFGHLLSIVVSCNGAGSINLTTASANPIEWFFGPGPPSDATIPVTDGVFAYANVGSPYVGYPTSGSHNSFRIANVGSSSVTVTIEIKGSNP
jgi:hypothetical protein